MPTDFRSLHHRNSKRPRETVSTHATVRLQLTMTFGVNLFSGVRNAGHQPRPKLEQESISGRSQMIPFLNQAQPCDPVFHDGSIDTFATDAEHCRDITQVLITPPFTEIQ